MKFFLAQIFLIAAAALFFTPPLLVSAQQIPTTGIISQPVDQESVNSKLSIQASQIASQIPQISALQLKYTPGFVFAQITTNETDVTEVAWLEEVIHESNDAVNSIFEEAGFAESRSVQYKLFINNLPYEAYLPKPKQQPESTPMIKPQADDLSIVLSPGHGWYYNTSFGSWRLQRSWYNGIVEDYVNVDLIRELKTKLDPHFAPITSTRELSTTAGNHPETNFPMWQMGAYKYLQHQGYPASVWNDDGGSKTEEVNYARDIRSRPLLANHLNADILVSLHNNGGGGCGSETLYDTTNGYGNRSFTLANSIQYQLLDEIRTRWNANWCNRGTKGFPGNYGENRIFNGPAALVEVAFMDRLSENNALQNPAFRSIVTDGIRDGILEYYRTPVATVTSPLDNTFITLGESRPLMADAVDTDGTVSHVDFYAGSTFISRDSNGADGWSGGNYTFNQLGAHALWAVATDNEGKYSSSLVSYMYVTDDGAPASGSVPLQILNSESKITTAAGRFWQVQRLVGGNIQIRYSFDQNNWSDWLPTYSAYSLKPMLYAARDGRLMLVTRSEDGLAEARFTSDGASWEWFDSLTPAAILTNSPDFLMPVTQYLIP